MDLMGYIRKFTLKNGKVKKDYGTSIFVMKRGCEDSIIKE